MKNIIVLFFALFAVTTAAQAQSESKYKTDVSIRKQLVNNSVPGAVYRDASVKTSKKSNTTPQKSIGAQIRGNAVPGVQYKTSNTAGSAAQQSPATSGEQVASDKKAEKLPARKAPEAPQLTQ
jgi:hypothetical protein